MNKAIHGAFRRDLDRFIAALETFSPGDRMRATQLATAWANFDDQLPTTTRVSTRSPGRHCSPWG